MEVREETAEELKARNAEYIKKQKERIEATKFPETIKFEEILLEPFPEGRLQRNSSKDDRIDENSLYLAQINSRLYAGNFNKVWFGWTFNGWTPNPVGYQLDSIERLWVYKED